MGAAIQPKPNAKGKCTWMDLVVGSENCSGGAYSDSLGSRDDVVQASKCGRGCKNW